MIRPQYEKQDVNYVVSVSATGEDGTNELVSEESCHAGDAVTLVAPAIDGMVFESWRDEDGKVLGHTETCMLYVTGNRNLFAHYVTEGTAVERVPVITINGFDKKVEPAGGHKVQCVMSRCVPDGYELVEHGVLYGYDLGSLTEDTFVIGAEGAKRFVYKRKEPINAAFLNMAVNSDDDVVFFRAYMTVKKSGSTDLVAYYSDIEATSFNSING